MAFSTKLFPQVLFFCCLFISGALAEIVCENLPNEVCAFSVSSLGKRCLLETTPKNDGEVKCRTSAVLVVEKLAAHIETDQCVRACGVDRKSLGISSDTLLDPNFLKKLCSPHCYHKCPNIIELHFNLAEGEGLFLPYLCEQQRLNPRRAMSELLSQGAVAGPAFAPGPVSDSDKSLRGLHYAFASGPQEPSRQFQPVKAPSRKFLPPLSPSFVPGPVLKNPFRKILPPMSPVFAPGPLLKNPFRKVLPPMSPAFGPSPVAKELYRKFHHLVAPVFAPGPVSNEPSAELPPSLAPAPTV